MKTISLADPSHKAKIIGEVVGAMPDESLPAMNVPPPPFHSLIGGYQTSCHQVTSPNTSTSKIP